MSKLALVIDDEAPLREIITEVLKHTQIDSLTAASGTEALEIANQTERIDLIIVDMNMPLMRGDEAYLKIKEKHPQAIAIFMSGFDLSQTISGMDLPPKSCFIKKPFTIMDLQKLILDVLS